MEAKLVILEGKYRGREIPILNTVLFIGRNSDCHVCLHSKAVSKRHCAVVAWAGKVRVRDLQSRNGTFVNGRPIVGEVWVGDGDELQIAHHRFKFSIAIDPYIPVGNPDGQSLEWLLHTPATARDASSKTDVLVSVPDHDGDSRIVSGGRLLREFVAKQNGGGR